MIVVVASTRTGANSAAFSLFLGIDILLSQVLRKEESDDEDNEEVAG